MLSKTREYIGQRFVVDFDGYEPADDIKELISEYRIGGVILFKKNIRDAGQARQLIASLQDIARKAGLPPLFVLLDQEGGEIQWLKEGVTEWPSAATLGATSSDGLAERMGEAMARELRWIGIHWNLAPVVDVASEPQSPLKAKERTLGDDPQLVSRLGSALIRGMQKEGIIATAKHFPGKGSTPLDAHKVLPTLEKSFEKLDAEDLLPFRAAIRAEVRAIMPSHVIVPEIDPTFPVTLSAKWLQDILREKMGFRGLIISDSLLMKAVYDRWGLAGSSAMALAAGNDVVLCLGPHEEKKEAIRRAQGQKFPESEKSVNRIFHAKNAFIYPETDPIYREWDLPEREKRLKLHKEIADEIRARMS